MSAASWSIPAIPRAVPPARGGPPGEAFLVAARPRAGRCRAAPRRLRLGRGAGGVVVARAGAAEVPVAGSGEAAVVFSEKFPLRRCQTVEGKAWVRVDAEPDGDGKCKVVIGCDLEGKWVLHWGVSYDGETGREWDQPPAEIRPPGSVPIKDSAIETPLEISHSSEGRVLHEVEIKFDKDTPIAVINFVLKEEGTGAWFQHKGGDFRIPLSGSLKDKDSSGAKQGDLKCNRWLSLPTMMNRRGLGMSLSTRDQSLLLLEGSTTEDDKQKWPREETVVAKTRPSPLPLVL